MNRVTFETAAVTEEIQAPDKVEVPEKPAKAAEKPLDSEKKELPKVEPMPKSKKSNSKTIIISLAVVLAGIATGYFLYQNTSPNTSASSQTTAMPQEAEGIEAGQTYGMKNGEAFTDEAEGVLVLGGVNGEGSHHIMRPGGPSQNVYLTSSVVNLSLFEGHLVVVWGETFEAQQAGWLMDVGKVEVKQLDAEKPFEEDLE